MAYGFGLGHVRTSMTSQYKPFATRYICPPENHFAKVATTNGVEVSVPVPHSYAIKFLQNKLIEDWESCSKPLSGELGSFGDSANSLRVGSPRRTSNQTQSEGYFELKSSNPCDESVRYFITNTLGRLWGW
ncbi:hypothetical protein TNCV_406321 [Trichonephila clavipes]|nr:hypothetical protein TNCV_406321 [Trichonephila clavipes]